MKTNLWEFFFLSTFKPTEAEFKEFEPLLKFKPRLKYGWFHLNLYSIFQDLIKPVFGRFKPRLKFIKFGHCSSKGTLDVL